MGSRASSRVGSSAWAYRLAILLALCCSIVASFLPWSVVLWRNLLPNMYCKMLCIYCTWRSDGLRTERKISMGCSTPTHYLDTALPCMPLCLSGLDFYLPYHSDSAACLKESTMFESCQIQLGCDSPDLQANSKSSEAA